MCPFTTNVDQDISIISIRLPTYLFLIYSTFFFFIPIHKLVSKNSSFQTYEGYPYYKTTQKILPTSHCEFLVFLAVKICRIKENFRLERAENSVIVPSLLPAVTSVSSTASQSSGGQEGGGGRVKRNVLSMRIIWSKLGLRLGSSTQHDCMMNASSGEISSERFGLSCCFQVSEKGQKWKFQGISFK